MRTHTISLLFFGLLVLFVAICIKFIQMNERLDDAKQKQIEANYSLIDAVNLSEHKALQFDSSQFIHIMALDADLKRLAANFDHLVNKICLLDSIMQTKHDLLKVRIWKLENDERRRRIIFGGHDSCVDKSNVKKCKDSSKTRK